MLARVRALDLRTSRAIYASLAMAAGSALQLALSFVAIRIALTELGEEGLGAWLVMSSWIGLLVFADLGIGAGVVNLVAEQGRRPEAQILTRAAVSTAFFFLAGVGLTVIAVALVVCSRVDWIAFYNVKSAIPASHLQAATTIMVVAFALNLPLSVAQRALMGYQLIYIGQLFSMAGVVLSFAGLIACATVGFNLVEFALVMSAGPLLASILCSLWLFFRAHTEWKPSPIACRRSLLIPLLSVGFFYFLIQIGEILAYQTDNLIIARVLGADAVPAYAVPLKLFMTIPLLAGFVLTPLWPAYRDAISSSDFQWTLATLRRATMLAALIGALSLPLAIVASTLIQIWTGTTFASSVALLAGLAVWTAQRCVWGSIAMFLNGCSRFRFMAGCTIAMAIVNLPLSYGLTAKFGLAGPVWGTVISQAIFVLLPCVTLSAILVTRMREPPLAPVTLRTT